MRFAAHGKPWKRRPTPRLSRGNDAVVANAGSGAPFASPFASSLPRNLLPFLVASIALSSILFGDRDALLAEAVESPTGPASRREEALSDLGPDSDFNPNRSEVVDESMKITRTIHSSEEDSISLPQNGNAHIEKLEDSVLYEPKAHQKQSPSSSRSDRKQRQKQRLMQRQKHQHQPALSSQEIFSGRQQYHSTKVENDAYMRWCEKVLGIQSVVEIKEFEYLDHLQMHWDESEREEFEWEGFDWLKKYSQKRESSNEDNDEDSDSDKELPTELVRGLAAKYDIQQGDIVISIPLYSLLSVPTTIDHDPVLSRILGPSARHQYGWSDPVEYEIALLVIAVLYHRSLGEDSPLSHYLDILEGTPTDFPFLWSDRELLERTGGDAGEGVRNLAQGIRQDLHEMYDGVLGTLVKELPEWFAPPNGYHVNQHGQVQGPEWIYSYENFRWAFALVISRHHYLPIQDFDDHDEVRPLNRPTIQSAGSPSQMQETLSTVSEVVPPANQPTDSWVDLAKNEERVVEDDLLIGDDDAIPQSLVAKHSFLAPLADLINFGPPCLTGSYNAEEQSFELIATCSFTEGQEVTFWYSSDCSDVIISNFGFLHPLVPPCSPLQDSEGTSDEWEEKARLRERELWEVYDRLDLLKDELAMLQGQLVSCGCEDGEKKGQQFYSMPIAENQKLRKEHSHSLRQENGVRGRISEQEQLTKEMMEELG